VTISDSKIKIFPILIMLIFFLGFGFYNIFVSKIEAEKNFQITLSTFANNMDKECPIDILNRNEVVIEKIYFLKKRTIVYEYRIMKHNKNDYDLQQLKENSIDTHIEELEYIESLKILRNNDVVFEYHYFDKQREEMFKIKLLFNTPIVSIN